MANITVLQSIAFREAFLELAPRFDRANAHHTVAVFDGGIQVMQRVRSGEVVDLVIMSADKIDELIGAGRIVPGSRTDLGTCAVGVAVRTGAPRPDIASGDAVKHALLAAKKIAFSTGPSGVHVASLIRRWGIESQLEGRLLQVKGEPAGAPLARGEADIAFQQMSELLPVSGIDIVGPLPGDIQQITTFSIGLHVAAPEPEAARALMRFLSSPEAAPVVRAKGM
jgi:molybdate transport system substrate-binding protein